MCKPPLSTCSIASVKFMFTFMLAINSIRSVFQGYKKHSTPNHTLPALRCSLFLAGAYMSKSTQLCSPKR